MFDDVIGMMINWMIQFYIKTFGFLLRLFWKGICYIWKKLRSAAGNKEKESEKISKEYATNKLEGVFFGKKKGKYITKKETEDGHVLVVGGAGSGKSSCIAIPTLWAWQNSVFAIDIKGELSRKANCSNMKIFNLTDATSYGYDPFHSLQSQENRVPDARSIALAIAPEPAGTKDPFWIQAVQNLLTGAILFFSGYSMTFIETMQKIQELPLKDLITLIWEGEDDAAKKFITQFVNAESKTLSGIAMELSNKIMLFATDPIIESALSRQETVTPDDLENGFDVFIVIPEDKLEQWKSLLTLICSQFLKHFERRDETKENVPVLFLLDEFPRLGKIEPVITGLTTLRSKKIHVCLIAQSLAQLDVIYGKDQRKVIVGNCQYRAVLQATDVDTQEYFAKAYGTYDKEKESKNINYDTIGIGKGTSKGTTTEEKHKIKLEEFAHLQDIVLFTPKGSMRVDKAPYYIFEE